VNSKKIHQILAAVLSATAFILFIFLIAGASGVKGGPGFFLVSSFHLASLYIPLYLILCAYALTVQKSYKLLAGLNLSILPFLTLTLLLHVLSGNMEIPVSRSLIQGLGIFLTVLFLTLFFGVESALIYKLGNLLFPQEKWLPELEEFTQKIRRKFYSAKKVLAVILSGLKRAKPEEDETETDTESRECKAEQREVFPFPDLPSSLDPPENIDDSEIQALISSVLRPEAQDDNTPLVKTTPPVQKRVFNPEKTLGISEVMDFEPHHHENSYSEEVIPDPIIIEPQLVDPAPMVLDPELPAVDSAPVFSSPDFADPGIDFLLNQDDRSVEEEPSAVLPLELEDKEYEDAGYISDRMEDLDQWRSPVEDAHSVEDKLSPQGESEKLGVSTKKFPAKHRRWQKYHVPLNGLLKEYPDEEYHKIDNDTRRAAGALEETLYEFKIDAKVTGISKGPVITMFEIQPAPGVKVSRIVSLQDNLKLRLAASRIRIVAPIPGKQAIGIEVPNKKRSIVSFNELVSSDDYGDGKFEIPVILGKDISGGNQIIDLTRTPHLLIAGSTGSGKSVCVNSLICSILFKKSPWDVKLMLVDPKIVELKLYNDIPHLLTPVITEPKRAFQAVQWCLYEMERRYALLDSMGVRDIKSFNRRIKEREIATSKLPYIVLVIDEFADLMATSGKELEAIVARLAAMSRAVGIHLVLATQRPSIDVITGLIKANFPSRIAFMVASKTDSRIIIDMMGAEKLLGKGDMLFTSAWDPFPSRMQGAFLAEDEVERVVSYVKTLGEPEYIDDEIFLEEEDEYSNDSSGESSFSDPLYNKSLDIVVQAGKASASYLQRRLKIGYNRAARLVEEMEIRGIVGPQNGSKPREVIHIPDRPGQEMLDTGE